MQLSIVDVSPVPPGATAAEALAATVELARLADRLGYARFWLAEHHAAARIAAASTPEILIARIGAVTERIRLGSGAVLVNQQSPFRIAESFRLLHTLFPDRVDLGLGRARSSALIDAALQDGARPTAHDDRVAQILRWLGDGFPADDPHRGIELFPGVPGTPQPWILGSSPASGVLAGELGLPYCYAAFLAPATTADALAAYRRSFRPAAHGLGIDAPHTMVGVNVCCAATEREAARLRAPAELDRRESGGRLLSADAAVAELGGVPHPTHYRPGDWPQVMSAAPERMADLLASMADEVGADEFMVHDVISDPADRRASYELLADACLGAGPAMAELVASGR